MNIYLIKWIFILIARRCPAAWRRFLQYMMAPLHKIFFAQKAMPTKKDQKIIWAYLRCDFLPPSSQHLPFPPFPPPTPPQNGSCLVFWRLLMVYFMSNCNHSLLRFCCGVGGVGVKINIWMTQHDMDEDEIGCMFFAKKINQTSFADNKAEIRFLILCISFGIRKTKQYYHENQRIRQVLQSANAGAGKTCRTVVIWRTLRT